LWSQSQQQQLPDNYQEYGTELIRQAGAQVGATSDQLDIQWKGDKIVVTVHGDTYAETIKEDCDDGNVHNDDMNDDDEESDDSDLHMSQDDADADLLSVSSLEDDAEQPTGVNVIALARAINKIFDMDDEHVGLKIASSYEIEVTTPGASDELEGIVMFEAYKGFEVIAQHQDPKSKNFKTVQGKLMERNDEFTIVNIKGRMKKMKNENVVSIKLPKAKKEKRVG
jgi:ribosome maturation factor RimP